MSGELTIERTGLVGAYTAKVSCSRIGIVIEWSPCTPDRLTRGELAQYRALRDGAMAELAERLGIRILMADTDGRMAVMGLGN